MALPLYVLTIDNAHCKWFWTKKSETLFEQADLWRAKTDIFKNLHSILILNTASLARALCSLRNTRAKNFAAKQDTQQKQEHHSEKLLSLLL